MFVSDHFELAGTIIKVSCRSRALVMRSVLAARNSAFIPEDDKRRVVVRMREALFKTGLLNGQSRVCGVIHQTECFAELVVV